MVRSRRNAQVEPPTLTAVNGPMALAGAVLAPQQARSPVSLTAQVCRLPALTATNGPATLAGA